MNGLDMFLDVYGIAAIFLIMLVKAIGVPVPIPSDVIMLGAAARAADGKIGLGEAFLAILLAEVLGGLGQFVLVRRVGRAYLYRFGRFLGLTPPRLDAASTRIQKGGVVGVGVSIFTPGVRAASVAACGLAGLPLRTFLPGLVAGASSSWRFTFSSVLSADSCSLRSRWPCLCPGYCLPARYFSPGSPCGSLFAGGSGPMRPAAKYSLRRLRPGTRRPARCVWHSGASSASRPRTSTSEITDELTAGRERVKPELFDPDRVAHYEAVGWRAYYERDWLKLLRLVVVLCEEQFRIPFPVSLVAAYYVARASRAWAPVDHDPDLVQRYYAHFYRLARRYSGLTFDPRRVAALELRYNDVHRRLVGNEDKREFVETMVELHAAVFELTPEQARESAEWRVAANNTVDGITNRWSTDVEGDWLKLEGELRACYRSVHTHLAQRA